MAAVYPNLTRLKKAENKMVMQWLMLGLAHLGGGIALYRFLHIPFIQSLWTLSFALLTTGIAALTLLLLFLLFDLPRYKSHFNWLQKILRPFQWLGSNAFLLLSIMVLVNLILVNVVSIDENGALSPPSRHSEGNVVSGWEYIYWNGFAVWILDRAVASLVMAGSFSFVYVLIGYGLFEADLSFRL
eukprot:TRINITY_DN10307_c0_g1_i2.p1 TRINITY_DN10307_c0_g1~~TRINITY_DN10307_c0_g1_i2.p1  ORF type:complete len:195 (+),score=32.91 TRINITY_DN10307_c0_g1_i2:28-585(+)